MSWIIRIQALITQYPDATALALGALFSWAPGLVLETWFLPEAWPARKTKQVTLSITVAIAFIISTVLWHLLDPADKNSIIGLVSFISALSAPIVHIVAAKIITHYVPYVDSVFKGKPSS